MTQSVLVTRKPEKLAIIGNGFDLALDAHTSYEDFYDCLKKCFESSCLDDFKDSYLYGDNMDLIDSFYATLNSNRENYFINYFLKYKEVFQSWFLSKKN